jgi:hypothetical protein
MNTAVQLRRAGDVLRSELLYGAPRRTVAGTLGPVALFAAGEIVAYRIRHRRRSRLFVFRTLEVDDRLAASLPGVHPRVHLLLEVHTAGRVRLVRGMFAVLLKNRHDPCGLPDGFYVRVGVALAGRLPRHKILPSLLSFSLGRTHPLTDPPTARSAPLPRGHDCAGFGPTPSSAFSTVTEVAMPHAGRSSSRHPPPG